MPEIMLTATEATELLEEKVTRLRTDMGQAQREATIALKQKAEALTEVSTLHQQRGKVIEEIAALELQKQQILDSLAETRANVTKSLDEQEAKARLVLDEAGAKEGSLKEAAAAVAQEREQLKGIKSTLLAELDTAAANVQAVVAKAREAFLQTPG